ncbi:hypothetical protein [Halalkalibacterium ligniniphilum]|uniref:hypothetical protein n=1 Tax=Halalkalibacterium ligniniphilum TaxID=1134413 RepID=UPI00036BCE82|nr:hypothetical protein [Halalkalibacterium ligniniphilum]
MIGVKGIDYLDAVWEIANSRGCKCNTSEHFSQDFLGEMRCVKCKAIIISQSEVNEMEAKNMLPAPKITNEKLNDWFSN